MKTGAYNVRFKPDLSRMPGSSCNVEWDRFRTNPKASKRDVRTIESPDIADELSKTEIRL